MDRWSWGIAGSGVGVRKDGSKLQPPMGYGWYATMNDADLSAIVAYLKTIPAR